CALCRVGDELNGGLPLFDGAGSAMFGYLGRKDGGWSLRHDGQVLAAGHGEIMPHVTLPATRQSYVLVATSHPVSKLWQLSTNVRDVWTFTSGHARATIPILLPS